jgi:hypothetical protein
MIGESKNSMEHFRKRRHITRIEVQPSLTTEVVVYSLWLTSHYRLLGL